MNAGAWLAARLGPLSPRVALPTDDGVMVRHEIPEMPPTPPNVTPIKKGRTRR